MQQTQSPLLRLWQLGRDHHGGLIAAIFCAVAGVLLGLLPYLSAGRILVALLTGQQDWNFYLLWCMVALGGYLAKTLLYNLALSLSHKATFQILRDIRKMILSKMPRLPLGDILDTSSGRLKQIVVDQVESMETTLAPPAAGDDLQSAGAGMRSRVSVYAGLAHGIAESGVHSCGHGFYDGHHGQLWQGLSGCGGDDPGHERDHCGIHRRH